MNSHIHPIFADILKTFASVPATPTPSVAILEAAMDDMAFYSHDERVRHFVNDRHFGAAACELFEKAEDKRGDWKPTQRESAVIEFMEKVEARAMELAEADLLEPSRRSA